MITDQDKEGLKQGHFAKLSPLVDLVSLWGRVEGYFHNQISPQLMELIALNSEEQHYRTIGQFYSGYSQFEYSIFILNKDSENTHFLFIKYYWFSNGAKLQGSPITGPKITAISQLYLHYSHHYIVWRYKALLRQMICTLESVILYRIGSVHIGQQLENTWKWRQKLYSLYSKFAFNKRSSNW